MHGTCVFYVVASLVALAPLWFVFHIWHDAQTKDWFWSNEDSRNMYVDAAKTLIAASGIAVVLLASRVSTENHGSDIAAVSAKVAVVCLILCVGASLVAMLAMIR